MTQAGDEALDIAKKRVAAEEKLASLQKEARESHRDTLADLREQIALVGMDETRAAQRTAIRQAEKQFAEAGLALTVRQRAELGLLIALLQQKKRLEEDKKAIENAENLIKRYQNEREQLDMTNNERELSNALMEMEALLTGTISIEKQKYIDALREEIGLLQKRREELGLVDKDGNALTQNLKQQTDTLTEIRNTVAESLARGLAQSFTEIITGSKSAEEAMKGLILQIGQLILQELLLAQIRLMMRSAGLLPAANGMAVSGGGSPVTAYAYGGVVSQPTTFPMSQGRTGLMGEAGPEAIMPLSRMPDGRLGVSGEGVASSKIVNVNMTVNTPDADSFRKSNRQINSQLRAGMRGMD